MPRKKSPTLTEVEQRLMEILWDRGNATVGEVQAALAPKHAAAFNTVQTTVRILEQKGYLRHKAEGRAFRYYPVVDRSQASNSAVRVLLQRFFDGDAGQLAVSLIKNERISADELARLERLIAEARNKE